MSVVPDSASSVSACKSVQRHSAQILQRRYVTCRRAMSEGGDWNTRRFGTFNMDKSLKGYCELSLLYVASYDLFQGVKQFELFSQARIRITFPQVFYFRALDVKFMIKHHNSQIMD